MASQRRFAMQLATLRIQVAERGGGDDQTSGGAATAWGGRTSPMGLAVPSAALVGRTSPAGLRLSDM
jgi:hypothetical protein